MAAWIPKTATLATKNHNVLATTYAIQICDYSTKTRIIKDPTTASLKRGTGGRSSFSGMVCTIFGSSGFIGGHLCNHFGRIGTQMILPYRSDFYNCMPLKLCGDLGQVLFHPWHLQDDESIIKCIKHSNVVVNLISREYDTKNFTMHEVNVEGARKLARLSRECGVERFIHLSCITASPHPTPTVGGTGSEFLKTKWEGEEAVKEEFPEATIIRPSVIYGQRDRFVNLYLRYFRRSMDSIPLWKKGELTEKQPIHVSDVAAGIVAVAQDRNTAGKTYQFVGPKRYKLGDLVLWLHRLTCISETQYSIVDIDRVPLFHLKVLLLEMLSPSGPIGNLHREGLKIEHATEIVSKSLPTLEDLGITPEEMVVKMPWEVKPYTEQNRYIRELSERIAPVPPTPVSASDIA